MIAILALASFAASSFSDPLSAGWNDVPAQARARMYWRVFGPAWDHANVDRQLRTIKAAGLSGVMTYFFYPVALDEPGKWHNQPFNSPEFLENLQYASQRAKDLGLRFSVCGSTGWPYGGKQVSLADSAQMLRKAEGAASGGVITFPRTEALKEGDRIVVLFQNGKVTTAPANGPVVAFIEGPTRMQVKRPSLGNEGLVIDHLNEAAVKRYLHSTVAPMLDGNQTKIESIFSDSLEVYRQNWTRDFPVAFKELRGYDLVPRLLELFDDTSLSAPKLRQDFWRTVAELAEQRYVRTVFNWAHEKNVLLELEPYGTPPLPMTSSAYIDLPTGEQYEWKGFNFCRYVSSAAHQQGKSVVGSEAWTWGNIPNRLTDSLSDLKLLSDMHFVSGVNDITGVDYPYSPLEAGVPGWLPYFGPSMNENNPQWAVFPELVSYLNRCSWMLRQGKPSAEVAVYLPVEDCMAKGGTEQLLLDFALRDFFVTGKPTSEFGLQKAMQHHSDLVEALTRKGLQFDGVDFWSINKLARTGSEAGKADMRIGEASYRAVILPRLESIDLNALRKLEQLCREGVILVATGKLPIHASGMAEANGDREVKAIVSRLFNLEPGQTPKVQGKATTYFVPSDADLGFLYDMDLSQAKFQTSTGNAAVVHRHLPDADIYFVANPSDSVAQYSLEPKPARRYLETWNPISGDIHAVTGRLVNGMLQPRGSRFIIARDERTPGAIPSTRFGGGVPSLGPGGVLQINLDGGWTIAFKGPDAPASQQLEKPVYWESLSGCDKFSGEGIYSYKLDWQQPLSPKAMLYLPEVHDGAIVTINSKVAGTVWLPPFELDISKFLRQGVNDLQIHVFSSMANRFIGLPDADMKALRAKYGSRFGAPAEKQIMKGPEHAGIGGSVRLVVTPVKASPLP